MRNSVKKKSEARMSKNSQLCGRRFHHSDFVILSDFVLRPSDLRIAVCSIKRPVSGLVKGVEVVSVHGEPPFVFSACIGTMNRWVSSARPKAPINRTHSRRFARFGDARLSRSVWSACVFSAAFPRQAAIRWPRQVHRKLPLSFFGMH